MTIIVDCTCGRRLKARDRLAGRVVKCPRCSGPVQIPVIDLGHVEQRSPQPSIEPPPWDNVMQLLTSIFIGWSVAMAAAVVAGFWWKLAGVVLFSTLGAITLVAALLVLNVYFAKSRAMREHLSSVDVLFGLAKLVLWEPTEGIVFLKDKQVHAVDANPNDGGGIRVMYPVLGDQLGLRVPLTIQSTRFHDTNVFTKDYLPVSVRMTLWWKLRDPERYYLSISQDVRTLTDVGSERLQADDDEDGPAGSAGQLAAAERWVAMMAESVGRHELGRASTAFLVAEQIAEELPAEVRQNLPGPSAIGESNSRGAPVVPSFESTTELLGKKLRSGIGEKIREYGLEIERVEVQEIRLPKAIHDAVVEACAVAFLPAKAQREARARELQLRAEANVLGADAVALREVLSGADGMSFLGVPDFLENLFGRLGQNRKIEQSQSG